MTLVQKSSLECVCASGVNTILLFAIISRWVFELLLQFLLTLSRGGRRLQRRNNCFSLLLTSDASEMSKTSLPLIAFALLAHFHTSPFFAMFLLIVATLNSPANYFLALYAHSLSASVSSFLPNFSQVSRVIFEVFQPNFDFA